MAAYTVSISVAIVSSSVANPTVITTLTPHGLSTGASVTISGHSGSTPSINGTQTVTTLSNTTFSIPVNVTVGGTGGKVIALRDVRIETMEHIDAENSTASFRCQVLSPSVNFRPARGQEIIAYEDTDGLFGGIIQRVTESGLGGYGVVPIVNDIEASSFDLLATYRVVYETVPAGSTLKEALQIIEPYLTPFGVALDGSQVDGPTMADAFDWTLGIRADAALQQIAQYTGYGWEIDFDKTLRMTFATAAPYDITTANGKAVGDITVEASEQNYANRVILKGGQPGQYLQTETFTGDGVTDTFSISLPIAGPLVPIAGAAVAYGFVNISWGTGSESIAQSPSGLLWEYDATALTIKRLSAPPANGDTFYFRYDAQFPITVIAEDTGEQAARGYVVERILNDEPDIFDKGVLQGIADAELAAAIAQAKTVRYKTRETGIIKPGQTQTITVAERDVNTTYVVTEVRTVNTKGNLVYRFVTAVEGSLTLTPVYRGIVRNWNARGVSGGAATAASMSPGIIGPAGSNYDVQYYKDGILGADTGRFSYEPTNHKLIVDNAGSRPATNLAITGGVGGASNGGNVSVTGGTGSAVGAQAGNLLFTAGSSTGANSSQVAGSVTIKTGDATNSSGSVTIGTGSIPVGAANLPTPMIGISIATPAATTAGSAITGGEVRISAGAGQGDGASALINGTAGNGGPLTLTAGAGGAETVAGNTRIGGNGGAVSITAGAGGNAPGAGGTTNTGGNGGDITLTPGAGGTGSTTNGTKGGVKIPAAYLQFTEMTAPAAGATNSVRIYAEDDGAGKTRLMALFPTGSAVQLAIEP